MLNISSMNFSNVNKKVQINKSQQNYVSSPALSPQYKYNLSADTVSFTGNKRKISDEKVRELCEMYDRRGDYAVKLIVDAVTPKNEEFLEELLALDNKKLNFTDVKDLLVHIDNEDTDPIEFKQKLNNYKNIKEIIENTKNTLNPIESELTPYLDLIPSSGVSKILQSHLLSPKKSDFKKFPECLEYATSVHRKYLKNLKKDKYPNTEIPESIKKLKTKAFMQNTFTTVMLFSQVFGEKTCNELVYNRAKYLYPVYQPRLESLTKEDMELLRKVQLYGVTDKETKGSDINVYPVSLEDKINTMNLLACNRQIINAGYEGIDFNKYITYVNAEDKVDNNLKVDFQGIKIDLMDKVLRQIGIDDKTVDNYMRDFREAYDNQVDLKSFRKNYWDTNYVHLLNSPDNPLFKDISNNGSKSTLLRDIIYHGTNGTFYDFLFVEPNEISVSNRKTKKAFEENGLNHNKWLRPTISVTGDEFINRVGNREKQFYVKNWDRCPQESLFDGNYTTCCTGIDKDHGDSFLKYLTRTCTTTLEVRTADKQKVVAMSRLFMAKVNGKKSMIIENIEVNNRMAKHYLYDDDTRYRFREMIFDYARNFAQHINNSNEEIPVYFCAHNFKVKDIEKGLKPGEKYTDVSLIGDFPNLLYINAHGGRYDQNTLQEGNDLKLILTDVTKRPHVEEKKVIDVESDSNYNYADVLDYNQRPNHR